MSRLSAVIDMHVLIEAILRTRRVVDSRRSVLVAVSGIDGSGKGYVTAEAARVLEQHRLRVATVNVDGFLNLPHIRFSEGNPGEHFYLNAIRFPVLFERLLLPLREHRSIEVEVDIVEETATTYQKRVYAYHDVDVVIVEGIYLLRRSLRREYDLSCWVECSFETALTRAIARAQEGLPAAETVKAYEAIYFPAQRLHFQLDHPRDAASLIVDNAEWVPAPGEDRASTGTRA